MKQLREMNVVSVIDVFDEENIEVLLKKGFQLKP